MINHNVYSNPLLERYSSDEMLYIFSNKNKHTLWRMLWVNLAKAQQKAGLPISNQQIIDMQNNVNNINYNNVHKHELATKHEVMAHILAFAQDCPSAKPIIHLGETSAFVLDNADILIYKQALLLIQKRLVNVINSMQNLANKYKDTAVLSYTHFQVAQPSTFGKRVCIWLNSILLDFSLHSTTISTLKLRGVKGTTGTAASFKKLLNNNFNVYKQLEQDFAQLTNFIQCYGVGGQTYDRKVDVFIGNQLSNIAVSCHKITNDLRLLQHLKEITEPFGKQQVGSSAMPYKQNPMLSERVSSLAKFVISLGSSLNMVASTQWLERTLDDSANKRLALPQMFLAIDAMLLIMHNLFANLIVNTQVINYNLKQELPFMILEDVLMLYVKNGNDRQSGHEIIKQISLQAKQQMLQGANSSVVLDMLLANKQLNISQNTLNQLLDINNISGFSSQQVTDFLTNECQPILNKFKHLLENPTVNSV